MSAPSGSSNVSAAPPSVSSINNNNNNTNINNNNNPGSGGVSLSNSSNGGVVGGRQVIEIWEPTYRMKPKDDERFIPRSVELIIKELMEKKLKKVKYEDQKCKQLSLELCSEIKERVKELNIPRYKIVLQTVIGEVKGQGAYVASRCLWDTETDNYASYSLKNSSLFCVVMVFGLYLE